MLSEQNRQKLDGIVRQMIANKESDGNIRLVVKDFSTKYNEQPAKKPTFLQSVATNAKKRAGDIKETIIKGGQGKINPLQSGIRTVGSVAGLAGDIVGSAITKTASAIIPEAVKKEWVTFGKDILQTPIGKEGLKMAAKGAEIYQNWKQNNPETAKDLEAVVNIASIFPISKGAKIAKEGIGEAVSMAGKGIAKSAQGLESGAKYATAQISGLSKNTVEKLIAKPGILKAGENITNESLGDKVKNALTKRIADLSSTGKEYETIRRYPGKVVIGDTLVPETLSKYGIGLENGKIKLTAESVPLKQGDINAIQNFINQYGKETELSGNAFMNARKALSNMAGYDADKSDISKLIAKELRKSYDELGKGQLRGLAELDAKFSSEKGALDKIKKEYLQKGVKGAYELKDNALTKIANATNEGRQKILGRLEGLVPGITEDINIYKVMRDIEAVKSQKVGAYAANAFKSGLGGYAVSGGNPIGALVGAIMSSPQVIVPILQSYGKFKNVSSQVIESVLNKIRAGKQLLNNEKDLINKALINKALINGADKFNTAVINKTQNIKPGLTIKDVGKNANPTVGKTVNPLIQEARKYKSAEEAINSPEMKAKWEEINKMKGNGKVTKTSNNLYHTTSAENLDSIRKNGLTTGNKARFEGVSSPNKISFSANEKGASYYGKQGDVMIRTKTSYKPNDLQIDPLAGGEGTYVTGKNIPPEMLEVKVNGKWQPLKSQPLQESPLIQEARKYKSAEEFVKAQTNLFHGTTEKGFKLEKGKPLFLAENFDEANTYAGYSYNTKPTGEVVEFYAKEGKTLNLNKTENVKKVFQDIKGSPELKKAYNSIPENYNYLDDYSGEVRILNPKSSPFDFEDWMMMEYQSNPKIENGLKIRTGSYSFEKDTQPIRKQLQEAFNTYGKPTRQSVYNSWNDIIKYAKEKGYDYIEHTTESPDASILFPEKIALNPEKSLLTKSQLTDIWNKANKK